MMQSRVRAYVRYAIDIFQIRNEFHVSAMTRSCAHAMLLLHVCNLPLCVKVLQSKETSQSPSMCLTNREMKRWLRSWNFQLTQTGLEASRKPAR
jgi:hypothetical protein